MEPSRSNGRDSHEYEKQGGEVAHLDDTTAADGQVSGKGEQTPDDFGFSPQEERSIIRRIDRRLVTTVGILYCISLMDRTNMSAANIAGMSVELNLIGMRYVRHWAESLLFSLVLGGSWLANAVWPGF
jgi:hypothetical protein